MIKEIVGATAVANWLMPNRRKKRMTNTALGVAGTVATIAGLGAAAYMMYKPKHSGHSEE